MKLHRKIDTKDEQEFWDAAYNTAYATILAPGTMVNSSRNKDSDEMAKAAAAMADESLIARRERMCCSTARRF